MRLVDLDMERPGHRGRAYHYVVGLRVVIGEPLPHEDLWYCEESCDKKSPTSAWVCTREEGHTGLHVGATGPDQDEEVVAIWGRPGPEDVNVPVVWCVEEE